MVKKGARLESTPPLNCWKSRPPNQLFTKPPEMVPGFNMSMAQSWPSVSPTMARSKKLSKLVSIIETGAAIEPRLKRGSEELVVS